MRARVASQDRRHFLGDTSADRQALWLSVVAGIGCIAAATPAVAERWDLGASVGITGTYTNNANFSLNNVAEGDFATSLSAGLNVRGQGARASLNGSIGVTGTLYATQTQNNSIAPRVDLLGQLEAIDNFAFVEAQASVSQTFNSPFGPQPGDLVTATNNRYTSQTYRLSPYVKGQVPGSNITYEIRDDNIWTLASRFGDFSPDIPNTYFNQLNASINAPRVPLGWRLEYNGTYYAPSGSSQDTTYGSYTIQVVRAIATYRVTSQLQVSGRGGYENDRFPLTGTEGVVYGAGGDWNPSDRTQMGGFWEHRFFGSSFEWHLSHRLPRISMSANFARGLNTYPQNALTIPAGVDVAGFVDAAFRTRIPDPAERALAVQQFMATSGLPPSLASPVNIFSASVQLQKTANAALVWLGVRNSIGVNLFYQQSEAISGQGSALPPALQFGQDNTQTGGGVSYSHRLSGQTNLTASATLSTTKSNTNQGPFADVRSTNGYVNVGVSTQLGPKTGASAGVNYSRFVPDGTSVADTTSSLNAYVSINHTF